VILTVYGFTKATVRAFFGVYGFTRATVRFRQSNRTVSPEQPGFRFWRAIEIWLGRPPAHKFLGRKVQSYVVGMLGETPFTGVPYGFHAEGALLHAYDEPAVLKEPKQTTGSMPADVQRFHRLAHAERNPAVVVAVVSARERDIEGSRVAG
jgi:hypothetical protein